MSAGAQEIFIRHPDFYVPAFTVKQDNKALGPDVVRDVIQVTYRDTLQEFDSFEITINNEWDLGKRSFKYSDARLFDPGSRIDLWMGYLGKDSMQLMLTGEVTSLRPAFPESGTSSLTVGGLNLLHRFRTKQESHSYLNKTDTQIAKTVTGRLRARLAAAPLPPGGEVQHKLIVQDNQYDILFLLERARRIGYDLFVQEVGSSGRAEESVLYFGPSGGIIRPAYKLGYGRSLIQFAPTLTTANQVDKVVVRAWDSRNAKPIVKEYTRKQLGLNRRAGDAGGRDTVDKSFEQREEIIVDHPVTSAEEAERLARSRLEENAKDFIKGSGSTVGIPSLRAGSVLDLDGLGERFSGRYFVTGTTHTINDSGYRTQFECRREEK